MRVMQAGLDGTGPGYGSGQKDAERLRAEAFIFFRIVHRMTLAKALRLARLMHPPEEKQT